jgi:hypothetical protein
MSSRALLGLAQVIVEFSERDGTGKWVQPALRPTVLLITGLCWINTPEPQGTEYGSHLSLLTDSLSSVVDSAFLYRQAAGSDQDCPYNGGAGNEVLATGAEIAFGQMPSLKISAGKRPVKLQQLRNATILS